MSARSAALRLRQTPRRSRDWASVSSRTDVPVIGYLGDHARDLAGFMASGADVIDRGGSMGRWLHGFLVLDPALLFGRDAPCVPRVGGLCRNAYPSLVTPPDCDAYRPGSYPQVHPFPP